MQSLYGAIANTNKKEIMVRVDDVYQKVLAIANKEQRGYITPQEFNLFADHAQMGIFEQYFYDLSQYKRRLSSNNTRDENPIEIIQQKLNPFKKTSEIDWNFELTNLEDFYRIESVMVNSTVNPLAKIPVGKVDRDIYWANSTLPLFSGASKTRLYYTTEDGRIYVQRPFKKKAIYERGSWTPGVFDNQYNPYLMYIKKPSKPNWTYVIHNQNALYDSNNANLLDFELHSSEENNLVISVLKLAGITMKDANLVQIASQEEIKTIQQQKQ